MRARAAGATALVAALVAGAALLAAAAAPASPACFGAAARDPVKPCFNPSPAVVSLDDPERRTGVPCRHAADDELQICAFGTPAGRARKTFALVGDSHAAHWLPALNVVAGAMGWRGFMVVTSGCYFSPAVERFLRGPREICTQWYRSALGWFGRHPEVSLAFVSQRADTPLQTGPGETELAIKSTAFARSWKALPKTVEHVVAIRDVPQSTAAQAACVAAAAAAAQRAGPVCAEPRASVLKPDAAMAAVRALHSPRFGAIDLTQYFCSARDCYPVVGGVLVHRGIDHITASYSRSLGPYLLRRLRGLMRAW